MSKLVESAGYSCLCAVMIPTFLHRLIAKWPSSPIFLCPEQWSMFVAHPLQIGPKLLYETRIINQDRSPLATFPYDGEMLIIEREVEILDIQGESLADPQASFQEQLEEESVTQAPGRNSFENAFNLIALHATRLRRIEFYPGNLAHRGIVEQVLLLGPGQKACNGCLLACSGGWTKMGMPPKECSQHFCSDHLHWPLVKRTKLG